MNFFEHQQRARQNSVLMLLLFAIAVAAIAAALNIVGIVVYVWYKPEVLYESNLLKTVPREVYVWTTAVVVAAIVGVSARRLYQLSEGGEAVAEMMDARLVVRRAADAPEQRLLNVVEEMAIASGIAVPRVFIMDGHGTINAFAAGYSPSDAAVIVTRGALDRLNREELQGMVAHEFSHILNGDMRLNVHLVGVIAGITVVGAAGAALMFGGRSERGEYHGGSADPRAFVLGLVLWLIGSIGLLAARLIKALISREREFLADASAVRFTRSTDGIGGALIKIGRRGSVIAGRHAEELSHMCIGSPVSDYFEFPWLRTHPPLDTRLERLMGPGAKRLIEGRMERAEAAALAAKGSPVVSELMSPLYASRPAAPLPGALAGAAAVVDAVLASVGNPTAAHVASAQRMLQAIPAEVRAAVEREEGAQAALFALLLGEGELRERQLALIGEGSAIAAQSARFADALKSLGAPARLPVLELAIPVLKGLSRPGRGKLLETMQALIEADRKMTLREFVVLTLCRHHIPEKETRPARVKHRSVDSVAAEAGAVLSLLAHAGKGGMHAFDRGMTVLGVAGGVLRAQAELTSQTVDSALEELKLLAPLKKPAFIKACLAVAMTDDRLTVAEGELVRAICAVLDTPLPPILETAETVA